MGLPAQDDGFRQHALHSGGHRPASVGHAMIVRARAPSAAGLHAGARGMTSRARTRECSASSPCTPAPARAMIRRARAPSAASLDAGARGMTSRARTRECSAPCPITLAPVPQHAPRVRTLHSRAPRAGAGTLALRSANAIPHPRGTGHGPCHPTAGAARQDPGSSELHLGVRAIHARARQSVHGAALNHLGAAPSHPGAGPSLRRAAKHDTRAGKTTTELRQVTSGPGRITIGSPWMTIGADQTPLRARRTARQTQRAILGSRRPTARAVRSPRSRVHAPLGLHTRLGGLLAPAPSALPTCMGSQVAALSSPSLVFPRAPPDDRRDPAPTRTHRGQHFSRNGAPGSVATSLRPALILIGGPVVSYGSPRTMHPPLARPLAGDTTSPPA